MLKRLRIENFALIDELEVDFGAGLNVLTGSTGAGKSIIVSAIEFATGKRASEEIVRTGKSSASVEAEFDAGDMDSSTGSEVEAFVSGRKIVIKRKYRRSGGGKTLIGDRSVNLPNLKSISNRLVSILGQHSHQALLDPSSHIRFLDSYAELDDDLVSLRKLYNDAIELRERFAHAGRNALEVRENRLNPRRGFWKTPVLSENRERQLSPRCSNRRDRRSNGSANRGRSCERPIPGKRNFPRSWA